MVEIENVPVPVEKDDDVGEEENADEDPPRNNYSSEAYWDDRYGNWAQEPFDWLFEWRHVEYIIERYIKRDHVILHPGCGNAPFSPDMYDFGFPNQVCLDTSTVVIEQMMEQHLILRPEMQWHMLDCRDTQLESRSFDAIIDKSLIDTLRCCDLATCEEFISEMYRLLKRDGIYMTFSLHEYVDDDLSHYYDKSKYDWKVATAVLKNPNYSKKQENSAGHTLIVCVMKESPFWGSIHEDLQGLTESYGWKNVANCLQAINTAFRNGLITEDVRGALKDEIANLPVTLVAEGSKASLHSVCNSVMKTIHGVGK